MKLSRIFLLAICLLFAGIINGQSSDRLESTMTRGGDDPNIEQESMLNPSEGFTDYVQPETKGGEPTRGAYCRVIFDNWTPYTIKCYVDRRYRGTVAPWGDGSVRVGSGSTRAYAVAEFRDGSRLAWGPITRSCYGDWWVYIE